MSFLLRPCYTYKTWIRLKVKWEKHECSTSENQNEAIKPVWRDEMKLWGTFDAEQENDRNGRNQPGERASAYFKTVHDDDDGDQNAPDYSLAWRLMTMMTMMMEC